MKRTPTKPPKKQVVYIDPEIVEQLPIEFTNYFPTHGEVKLLHAMMQEDAHTLSVGKLCDRAGISTETYYRGFKKPEFKQLMLDLLLELIKQNAMPMIGKAIQEAKSGSFQHLKFLMEFGQIAKPSDMDAKTITIRFADPDDEQ